ncbi:MAG: response regulator [Gorillibacterium sp.]|nr:response regulator [Gorillibacterium sp.]
MHKVLLVDDEGWVVESLKDLVDWAYYGFEVVGQAASGGQALEAIGQLRPDVVFTDIRMPEMNGLELIQRGADLPFPVYFVVVSGYAEFAYAQKALKYGAVGYCLKPFDEMEIATVLVKVKALLEKAKPSTDTPLMRYLEDPSLKNRSMLQDEIIRCGVQDWKREGLVCVVTLGPGELPVGTGYLLKLKTGPAKTAYLLTAQQSAVLGFKGKENLPPGLGIGVSGLLTDLSELRNAIASADVLAHQYFVTLEAGLYYPQQFEYSQLNAALASVHEAIRAKDVKSVYQAFDGIEHMFKEKALSIRHAFQVYNMTISFLFKLGQTESSLYSYEQLAQSFPHVFEMLVELKVLVARYLVQSDFPVVETRNQTFNSIVQFVTSNFQQDLSLQSLSDQFYMNPSYISQLFTKEVGETFTAYITKLRIAYACELLESEEYTIQEITEKVGYHDYFYFIRLFKKSKGQTPTQYRDEHV